MKDKDEFYQRRHRMVESQIQKRGIKDPLVLAAMQRIPRHRFVPADMAGSSYADEPLPIGNGQTISQPYIVAYMTQALGLEGGEKILEIGTGSGYQTAVLAEIAKTVFSVEVLETLSTGARKILSALGYHRIFYKITDGHEGWAEFAPYDAIIVTAAPRKIPKPLEFQLKNGGRMIIPVGDTFQDLILISRSGNTFKRKNMLPVRFVPLIKGN